MIIREIIKRAYVLGFEASGERYNGEYPFDYDLNAITRELAGHDDIEAIAGQVLDYVLQEHVNEICMAMKGETNDK